MDVQTCKKSLNILLDLSHLVFQFFLGSLHLINSFSKVKICCINLNPQIIAGLFNQVKNLLTKTLGSGEKKINRLTGFGEKKINRLTPKKSEGNKTAYAESTPS